MKILPLSAGQTVELRHPLGGAAALDLTTKLRQIKMTAEEVELFRQVSQQKADLSAKAAAYSATKLRDELELAKQDVAAQTTPEGLEASLATVAKLAGMAETPAIAKAVEREAHAAIQPELARLDKQLIPLADRLIAEVRVGLEKATKHLSFQQLGDWIEDDKLAQVASYCQDRVLASNALLDQWELKAASDGAQAFLADDRAAT
jgi:hypothetical protein